jgi:hypothetical protein
MIDLGNAIGDDGFQWVSTMREYEDVWDSVYEEIAWPNGNNPTVSLMQDVCYGRVDSEFGLYGD